MIAAAATDYVDENPVTAVMSPRVDPFTDATCREPGRLPRWWDVDARDDERKLAAKLCTECPALLACGDAAAALGSAVSGTWAGRYHRFTSTAHVEDDALSEFLTVFGPSAAVNDNPPSSHQPVRYGRYWLHPHQMRIHYREAN